MRRRALIISTALALAPAGCGGSSSPKVELEGGGEAAGGKALVFTGSSDAKLVQQGSTLALELRGIDVGRDPQASYDRPDYVDETRCSFSPCEWVVLPERAGRYEFRVFLVDIETQEASEKSGPLRVEWAAPPRPADLKLMVNGKSYPLTPVETGADEYLPVGAGTLTVEARWAGDAAGSGYEVVISNAQPEIEHRCSGGTACRVPDEVPILENQEMSWLLEVRTADGDKVVDGYQVCLVGRA